MPNTNMNCKTCVETPGCIDSITILEAVSTAPDGRRHRLNKTMGPGPDGKLTVLSPYDKAYGFTVPPSPYIMRPYDLVEFLLALSPHQTPVFGDLDRKSVV